MKEKIALIAGEGSLPLEICRSLTSRSFNCVVYSLRSDNSEFKTMDIEIRSLQSLDFAGIIGDIKHSGIVSVILAGMVPKSLIYKPEVLDDLGREMLSGLKIKDDHSLLGMIVATFEDQGLHVISYRDLIPDLLANPGNIGGRVPTIAEHEDIRYGVEIMKILLPLSFGQTIVISDGSVVAVEAMEGTDETLKRAENLCRGGVVVKMMKPGQDERFDLPTVGITTLENMKRSGLTCLAVESDKTIILDKESFCELASMFDIAVVGI